MENFNKLYKKYRNEIFVFINSKLRDECSSEELTNDTFMKVYQNIDKFIADKATVKTWIYTIAKNAMIDHIRTKAYGKAQQTLKISDLESDNDDDKNFHVDFEDTNITPDLSYANDELKIRIRRALKELPLKQRRIANLYFNCELSYEEICEKMNTPLGTVKGTLFRARKTLQENLINA